MTAPTPPPDNQLSEAATPPTIGYATYGALPGRRWVPRRFAVMGGFSIAFGLLGFLGNFVAAWLCWGWMPHPSVAPRASSSPVAVAVPPVPSPSPLADTLPAVVPFNGDLYGPDGLPAAERALIVDWAKRHSRLGASGQGTLDALLAECGRRLFPDVTEPLDKNLIERELKLAKDLVPVDRRVTNRTRRTPMEIGTPGGTVLANDFFEAAFIPTQGGATSKVSIQGSRYLNEFGHKLWSYNSITQSVRQITNLRGKWSTSATSLQLGALAAERRSESAEEGELDIIGFYGVTYEGTLLASGSGPRVIEIDTLGRVRYANHVPADLGPPPPPPPFVPPPPDISRISVWLLTINYTLGAATAVLLGVAGRRLWCRSATAIAPARAYVLAQVSMSVFEAILGIFVSAAVYAKLGLPPPTTDLLVCATIAGFLLSCIWPALMLWATRGPLADAFLVEK